MPRTDWIECTKQNPCPICGKPDWCGVTADGIRVHCHRVESGAPTNTGWCHTLKEGSQIKQPLRKPKPPRLSHKELHERFKPMVDAAISRRNYRRGLEELEAVLGVPTWPMALCRVAWYPELGGWGFPETNDEGLVMGIALRYPGGKKRRAYVVTSRPGLFGVPQQKSKATPLYIVEGASDVLAGLAMGLRVIGLPAVGQGGRIVARLLRREPEDLPVVVIAERDKRLVEKPRNCPGAECPGCRECWPGLIGALSFAKDLRNRVRQQVEVVLLDGAKDLRAWYLVHQHPGMSSWSDEELASLWKRTTHKVVEE